MEVVNARELYTDVRQRCGYELEEGGTKFRGEADGGTATLTKVKVILSYWGPNTRTSTRSLRYCQRLPTHTAHATTLHIRWFEEYPLVVEACVLLIANVHDGLGMDIARTWLW